MEVSATDDHTDGDIGDLKKGKKGEDWLIFNESDSVQLNIRAYFVEKNDKLTDTPGDFASSIELINNEYYKFGFNFTVLKPETKLMLNLTSPNKIIYRSGVSGITGHFVWDEYYTDFQDVVDAGMIVDVTKLSDYNYLVKIYDDPYWAKNYFVEIDPVTGGLNTITEYANFTVDNTAPQYENISAIPSDDTSYSPGKNYIFNISWEDNIGGMSTIFLEWNGSSNYSATSLGNNNYSHTLTDLKAYNYTYKWFANDSVD
ncbi:unnamed protein product, partial [marine sediment metagenome]